MAIRWRFTPYKSLLISFGTLIVIGGLLFMLPGMTRSPMSWIDALFMSTSSVCVTGLATKSIGTDFTLLGQVVVLCLFQIGGLGFMTLSSSLLAGLRQRVTLGRSIAISETLGHVGRENLPRLLLRCMKIVATVEAAGFVLLFIRFAMDIPGGAHVLRYALMAAWQALFHSVSAFCNCGLGLWDDSMMRFADDWFVNSVISAEIILGGLGFFVLVDVQEWLRSRKQGQPRAVKFQTRLVIWTSLWLLLAGTVLIWIAEKDNAATFGNKAVPYQLLNAFFQSVSARTAGFNTLNISDMSNASLGVLMLLMFIGGSPGSCAGGVKTTTFAVLTTLSSGAWRSRREPSFHGRAFGPVTVRSAMALFFLAGVLVLAGTFFLMFHELSSEPFHHGGGAFVSLLFEVISAFGTVGLSTGITPALSVAGKLCITALMFLGRVGPLGLISATLRGGARPDLRYPYEDVQIG